MKTGYLFIILVASLYSQAQAMKINNVDQHQLDSLKRLIEGTAPDTARLNACLNYVMLIRSYDSLETIIYVEKGKAIARQIGLKNKELYLLFAGSYYYYNKWYLDTTISINKYIVEEAELINYTELSIESYNRIGDAFWWGNNYDSALLYYQKGLIVAKSTNDNTWQATITLSLADTYHRLTRYQEALRSYKQSEAMFRLLRDKKNLAICLKRIAITYSRQRNFSEALNYFQKASVIAKSIEYTVQIAAIDFALADMQILNGNFSKAIHLYELSGNLLLEVGDEYNAVKAYLRLGDIHVSIGDYRLAMLAHTKAALVSRNIGDESLEADVLNSTARMEYLQGEYKKAFKTQVKCLELYKKQERKTKQVNLLNRMGRSLQKLESHREAMNLYREALKISLSMNDTVGIANSYLSMALVYSKLNRVDSLNSYFVKALQYYEKMSVNNEGIIIACAEIGDQYLNRANIYKALELYDQGLRVATVNLDTLSIGQFYDKISELYQMQENYPTALSYQEKALKLYKTSNNIAGIAATNIKRAVLLMQQGHYAEAITYSQKAVTSYNTIDNFCKTGKPFQVIGESYLYEEQTDSAFVYLYKAEQQAKKCGDIVTLCNVTHLIGKVYEELGEKEQAFKYHQEALKLAQKSNNRELLVKTARTLYPLYEEKGKIAKALEVFRLFHANSDSLNKKENSKALIRKELTLQHETELQKAALLQQQKDERQQWINYAIIGACLALLAISLAVYRNYRNKYKANQLLTAKNAEIASQKAELEALDQTKSRFFTNISHELRTPLTLISSPLQGLLKHSKEQFLPATKETLRLMERNTKQLKGLVNDILDLSKLESNEVVLYEEEISIHFILNRVFANFSSLASHLGISYTIDLQMLPDEVLLTDTAKLEKIMNNLLSNAIKHTPSKGSVTLSAKVQEEQLCLEVKDTGKGISTEDLPYIFNRFYQSKQTDMPFQGGTGIGLSLANELCHLMGGSIIVESEVGTGSIFSVLLPYKVLEAPVNRDIEESLSENDIGLEDLTFTPLITTEKSAKILIVEDHPDMQQFVNSLIMPYHHTFLACNGIEALKILEQESIDLIISDVMMPEMDGYTLLQSLKDSDAYRSIPVIMLTALGDEQHKLEALTLGVDDYLTKPFSPQELRARVDNLLERNLERISWQEEEKSLSLENDPESDNSNDKDINFSVNRSDVAWLKEVEKAIEGELENEDFRLTDLAEQFFLSERQFQRRIKKVTGLTPKKYQQEIAMQQARKLLEEGAYSTIKAVAYSIGMHQTYRFIRLYEGRFGKHPQEYFEAVV